MKANRSSLRELVLAAGALLATLALVLLRLVPPAPLSTEAPPDRFSAGRALLALREILGDGAPHPVGSEANAAVRDRIVANLQSLGYTVETQSRLVCGRFGACAPATNLLARREGQRDEKAIALVAHYDSVPAGPGAADDGAGVAILLEIARLVREEAPWRRSLVFLFTDGEEAGLLGAQAFVDHHAQARQIGAVVNVEARGTRGPSLLFETKGDEAELLRAFARHAPRPVTSSLFSSVYERMPNDSDLSVFGRAGLPGVNFAFLGDVAHYHTPLDSLAHLSPRSLQHQGDQALAMARALAEADDISGERKSAIYFDLLALGVVRYPAALALPLAGFAAAGLLSLVGVLLFRQRRARGEVARGLAASLFAPALALVTALGLVQMLGLAEVTRNWVAHPAPLFVSFIAVGLLAATLFAAFTREDAALSTYAGYWLGLSLLSLPVALLLPGASYLLTVPSLAALLGGAVVAFSKEASTPRPRLTLGLLLPAVVMGALWFPILAIVYDAVGLLSMPALASSVALLASSLLPFASALANKRHPRLVLANASLVVVSAFAAGFAPASSVHTPERLSLSLHQDLDVGQSSWLASPETGRLPLSMRDAASFEATARVALPWSSAQAFVAPAEVPLSSGPELDVRDRRDEAGVRRLRLHLRPAHEGDSLLLAFPPGVPIRGVFVEGERASLRVDGGYGQILFRGVPQPGLEVDVEVFGKAPALAILVQRSSGLPQEAATLIASRPKEAAPSQEGDLTQISRRFEL